MYHTNTMNAKWALDQLAETGILLRIRHQGSFVTEKARDTAKKLLEIPQPHVVLLYSGHPTNIHWNEMTVKSFRTEAGKRGHGVVLEQIPAEKGCAMLVRRIRELLLRKPSALVVFFDNFEAPFLIANADLFDVLI